MPEPSEDPTAPLSSAPGEISSDEVSSVPGEISSGEISSVRFPESLHEIPESAFLGPPIPPDKPLLIRLDPLLMTAIDAERPNCPTESGHPGPRTRVIRQLIREALDARVAARVPKTPEVA